MYARTITRLTLCLASFAPLVAAADEITLGSLRGDAGEAAVARIENERRERILQLLKVAWKAEMGSEEQRRAIFLLGELRAKEAVPWLIENIDKAVKPRTRIKGYSSSDTKERITDIYPCIGTLEKLGGTISDEVVLAIKDAKGKERRRLLLNVLVWVEGRTFAQLHLERELEAPVRGNPEKQKKVLEEVLHDNFIGPRLVAPDYWPDSKDDYLGVW